MLRTLVNAGVLAPGEERHPSDEIYRLSDDDPLKQLLLEGRSYVGVVDDPDLHQTERVLLERLGRRSCLAVPIMLGDVAWGELWASRGHDRPDFDAHDLRLLERDRRPGRRRHRPRRAVRRAWPSSRSRTG